MVPQHVDEGTSGFSEAHRAKTTAYMYEHAMYMRNISDWAVSMGFAPLVEAAEVPGPTVFEGLKLVEVDGRPNVIRPQMIVAMLSLMSVGDSRAPKNLKLVQKIRKEEKLLCEASVESALLTHELEHADLPAGKQQRLSESPPLMEAKRRGPKAPARTGVVASTDALLGEKRPRVKEAAEMVVVSPQPMVLDEDLTSQHVVPESVHESMQSEIPSGARRGALAPTQKRCAVAAQERAMVLWSWSLVHERKVEPQACLETDERAFVCAACL